MPTPLSLRGFMADAARLPEKPEHYHRLIDFLADWNFNALLFRLTDDQGSALRWQSHPELITHRHALRPEQMREIVRHGVSRGVELIPEIESFGHSMYITDAPQHADLSDKDPQGLQSFGGMIPVHPRTLRIMHDLYREAAGIFPSRYLHAGCDEVNWGGSALSREALAHKSRTQIWAELLNSLNDIARSFGKELIVWGDHVLHHDPAIAEQLNKDIIIHDWQYAVSDPSAVEKDARRALDHGLRVIGGPAMMWCKWGPRPGSAQLENMDAFAEAYRNIDHPKVLGVLVTWWVPTRLLPNSIFDAIAYTAVGLNEGAPAAQSTALRQFVERHYGAAWNETWADIFQTIYDRAPVQPGCALPWMKPTLPVPWASDEQLQQFLQRPPQAPPALARVQRQLAEVEPRVRTNRDDFRAFRLSIDCLAHLFERNARLLSELNQLAKNESAAAAFARDQANRDAQMRDRLIENWNAARPAYDGPPDDPRGLAPGDTLLDQLDRATRYSAHLADHPAAFLRLLKSATLR